ncbi:hypothetical protein DFP72DRAFT_341090 [Ephemerocybe angulata]|uniref:G domain-containing protein n=1 Tax=Ephemerocybe angulata TaxID=980116 RepID=A0A8H6I120_9AGAR|nr:hypothetical protein DFP72DRAFT_341090 [Tulosesus angulatus]
MGEHTIVVLGRSDAGKTTFIKAIQNAVDRREGPAAEEEPTLSIVEYELTLPGGQSVTFVDTPGFDGVQPGGEPAKKTEEILQMLEEHLGANGCVMSRFRDRCKIQIDSHCGEHQVTARVARSRLFQCKPHGSYRLQAPCATRFRKIVPECSSSEHHHPVGPD